MSDSQIYETSLFPPPWEKILIITSLPEEKWWPSYPPTSKHMFHFLKSHHSLTSLINGIRKRYYKSINMRMINNEDIKEQN